MLVLSIIIGIAIGFIMFRVVTSKTPEKRRDWLAVGVVTTILCVIISGGVWAVNAIIDNTPKRPYCDPSEMPMASVGGGKNVEDDSASSYEPIREDLLSPPAVTGRIVQEPDPAIASDPVATDDFDPDSI